MKSPNTVRSLLRKVSLLTAVAVIVLAGRPILAQQRVEARGDALDANTRVGDSRSYGVPSRDVNDRYRLNNAIVTGDVTGGRGFRDFVPYRSDRSFRDFGAGRLTSNFIGRSAGALPSGTVINNAGMVRPYYGSSQVVQPRGDYVRLPGSGGYVPASAFRTVPTTAGRLTALESRQDLRLSRDDTDSGYDRSYWDALDELTSLSPAARDMASRTRVLSPYTTLSRDTRLEPLTPERLATLRSEVSSESQRSAPEVEQRDKLGGGRTAEGAASVGGQTEIGDRAANSQAEGGAAVQPRADSTRQRLEESLERSADVRLADPAEQSSQYALLQERLKRLQDSGVLDSQRPLGQSGQPDQPAAQGPPDASQPGLVPQPTSRPATGAGLPGILPPRQYPLPGATKPQTDQPLVISSLADGVVSPTLRRMYQEAEGLMDEGRYVSAIARYNAAERVVPNQPLTLLGRAAAELGAGYYRRCATTLELSFRNNPELMMARLDLPGLIGQQRLEEVTAGLQQRLGGDLEDPDPAFLLAFIHYHGGNLPEAARLLELAQERSTKAFYGEVAAHWGLFGLPKTQPEMEPK